jgi:hypothetical protein
VLRESILPQLTTVRGSLPREKKCQRERRNSRAPCGAPRLNVALARLVDLKAALLAETSARGPDGSRMRSLQLGDRPLASRGGRQSKDTPPPLEGSERRRSWVYKTHAVFHIYRYDTGIYEGSRLRGFTRFDLG